VKQVCKQLPQGNYVVFDPLCGFFAGESPSGRVWTRDPRAATGYHSRYDAEDIAQAIAEEVGYRLHVLDRSCDSSSSP